MTQVTAECARLGLRAFQVESGIQVEVLRLIRNECRDGFAHDNEVISEIAQRAWWVANRGLVAAWLYSYGGRPPDTGVAPETVGYGMLRQTADGRWWSSVGVSPQHTGRGYGGAITADVVRRCNKPVWASARLDNPAAVALHRAADWVRLADDERLAHFVTRPHVYDEVLGDWAEHGMVLT